MASLFDSTKNLEDIGAIYRRMTMNCPNGCVATLGDYNYYLTT